MDEERYVLARFIRELMAQNAAFYRKKDYGKSWSFGEICQIIEQIRADAVLGEDIKAEVQEVE